MTSFRVFVPQSEPVDAREIASDTTNDLAGFFRPAETA